LSYTVHLTRKAERQVRKLAKADQRQLVPHIDSLAREPRPDGCKKLAGKRNIYRIRVGDFRILYQIEDKELLVLVAAIGQRRDIYEELKRLR
jgi:mRNA interferase RelE/StbE